MNRIIAYLTFNGNCREAMEFYQQCLGGQLHLQTIGDTPAAEGLPMSLKKYVVHAALQKDNMILMGTDMNEEALEKGNSVSILLECSSETEVRYLYDYLVQAGKATHPLEKTYMGALFGGLTDKYGTQWLFHYVEDPLKVAFK